MTYAVKEIFKTLQGEGAQAAARPSSAGSPDATYGLGARLIVLLRPVRFATPILLGPTASAVVSLPARLPCHDAGQNLGPERSSRYVVFTGGEPLLQLDVALIDAVHAEGFEIAIETNGTLAAPAGIDWICVSPKGNNPLVQTQGDELKLVFLQSDAPPERFEALDFSHFFLQPMDGPGRLAATEHAVQYCMDHPKWRLSVQTHKYIGIP